MWTYLVALLFLASAIKCQTYQQRASAKALEIETSRAKVISVYSGQQSTLQNLQLGMNSIVANLPTSIVNDRQAEAFAMLEVAAALTANTDEQLCVRDIATNKANILANARRSLSMKTQFLSLDTTKASAQIYAGITKVNSAAVTARTKILLCGSSSTFKVSDTVFNYCLVAAETPFKAQETSSIGEQSTLASKLDGFVSDIVQYQIDTIQSADSMLNNYLDSVKLCVRNSQNVVMLNSLLNSVTALVASDITNQITNPTSTETDLFKAKSDAELAADAAAKSVMEAITAKSVTLDSATANLTTNFTSIKTRFDNAINRFASDRTTTTCVTNIRNTISYAINRGAAQQVSCVGAIQSATLSTELTQLQQSLGQSQSKIYGIKAQCISDVDNLFIADGITKCRQDAEADITTDYQIVYYKVMSLNEEATSVKAKAQRCQDISVNLASKQISKDKLKFENCIFKATKQSYTI